MRSHLLNKVPEKSMNVNLQLGCLKSNIVKEQKLQMSLKEASRAVKNGNLKAKSQGSRFYFWWLVCY